MAEKSMSWRTPVFIAYCALLLAGSSYLASRDKPEDPRFTAGRPMAVNHLVQTGDLVAESGEKGNPSELNGRFAASSIRQGQKVQASDFIETPLLRAPDAVSLELPVRGRVGTSNAGHAFTMCKGSEDLGTSPAAALMCAPTDAERKNCTVIVQLSLEAARKVLAAVPAVDAMPAPGSCTPEIKNRTGPERPSRG